MNPRKSKPAPCPHGLTGICQACIRDLAGVATKPRRKRQTFMVRMRCPRCRFMVEEYHDGAHPYVFESFTDAHDAFVKACADVAKMTEAHELHCKRWRAHR